MKKANLSSWIRALFGAGLAGIALPVAAGDPQPLPTGVRRTPLVEVVDKTMPSVVNISTENLVTAADAWMLWFSRNRSQLVRPVWRTHSLGSGVIVCCGGLVVTNYHIARRASEILVTLWDGRTVEAQLIAHDHENDLALLKLDESPREDTVRAIEFARPGDLCLGETVVAVGNPFGLGHSVSGGLLSAKNRSWKEGRLTFNDILQTDAAINPGNSGGPLVNLEAELIGLNTAINPEAEGIGFAVPVGRIEAVLARWLVPSRFSIAYVGFIPKTGTTESGTTALVGEVAAESPAAAAGLEPDDRILQVNGNPVTRALDVGRWLWRLQAGDKLTLVLHEKEPVTMSVGVMPPPVLVRERLGLRLQELTPALRRALGLPDKIGDQPLRGLAISEVLPGSDFASLEARRGDVILQIEDTSLQTLDNTFEALQERQPGEQVRVLLLQVDHVGRRLRLQPHGVTVRLN